MSGGTITNTSHRRAETEAFVRNNYFYGKLMDVHQFRLESDYFNSKRWMLNHLVLGFGTICGLRVLPGKDPRTVIVMPGVALDKWGREIVVDKPQTLALPQPIIDQAQRDCPRDQQAWVQVMLCYRECLDNPVPPVAGDCTDDEQVEPCTPGSILERFRFTFKPAPAQPCPVDCRIDDAVINGRLNYRALIDWVTNPDRGCHKIADEPCIVLANVRLSKREKGHGCHQDDIDNSVRRIVLTNRLIADLLSCIVREPAQSEQEE